jgi:hypothetical protein
MASSGWLVARGFTCVTFWGGGSSPQEFGYWARDGQEDINVRDQFPDRVVQEGLWK